MSRPLKDGLDYFPKDTGFYHDPQIRALIGRFGSDGVALYDYLLCEAYGRNGYYIEIDDLFVDIVAADLRMSPEKIGLILDYLLNKSMLFDGTLFKAVKVLTSHGIQTRYQEAVRGRAKKRGISVNGELWLLKEAETEGFIQVRHDDSLSRKNPCKSGKNHGKSTEKSIKERKEKESKGKEMKEDQPPRFCGPASNSEIDIVITAYKEKIKDKDKFPITEKIRSELIVFIEKMGPECCIRAMNEAVEAGIINWRYVRGVLEKKQAQGVKCLADWDALEERRKKEKQAGDDSTYGWARKARETACKRAWDYVNDERGDIG